MTRFAAQGISLDLPPGWDAQVRTAGASASSDWTSLAGQTDLGSGYVLHAASFPLPPERGDYGSGAVELMGGSDILICLLEHDPSAAGTALFRHEGVPALTASMFSPNSLQRAIAGMAGSQHFFQAQGRPFCLYVVLGSHRTRGPLVRTAAGIVRTLQIST